MGEPINYETIDFSKFSAMTPIGAHAVAGAAVSSNVGYTNAGSKFTEIPMPSAECSIRIENRRSIFIDGNDVTPIGIGRIMGITFEGGKLWVESENRGNESTICVLPHKPIE